MIAEEDPDADFYKRICVVPSSIKSNFDQSGPQGTAPRCGSEAEAQMRKKRYEVLWIPHTAPKMGAVIFLFNKNIYRPLLFFLNNINFIWHNSKNIVK